MTFPALKLVRSPKPVLIYGHAWKPGELVPVPNSGLTFGGEGDVRAAGMYSPHCTLDGGLVLRHPYARGDFSIVNGQPSTEAMPLHHRDLLELKRGALFRVLEREDVEARSPTLEAAIAAAPEDDEVVQVWRDFLLDQGDPLGERIAQARAGEELRHAPWLDALAPHYEMCRLEVSWKNGLATRAVLRDSGAGFESLKQALEQLLALRVMRFLRELVVDISSDQLNVKDGLAALAAVTLPLTLRKLSLGDVPDTFRMHSELALATFARPVEVGYFSGALLEVVASMLEDHKVGDRIEVGQSFYLGAYSIQRQASRYDLRSLLEKSLRPKVHGRPVNELPLRDGDIIELGTQLSVRFTLVR